MEGPGQRLGSSVCVALCLGAAWPAAAAPPEPQADWLAKPGSAPVGGVAGAGVAMPGHTPYPGQSGSTGNGPFGSSRRFGADCCTISRWTSGWNPTPRTNTSKPSR